tara:strand:- start:379 stop:579 length:201 start_codon:yes stop_codon:yes gene_type:complete
MRLKDMILYDIELFKKECKEPNIANYRMFVNYIIENYQIPQSEFFNIQIDIERQMKTWLKKYKICI